MASPGDRKGQRRGSCGHAMASFDLHDKCARCRDKNIGKDDCVLNKSCSICDGFSDSQRDMLATPTYKIRKDKKAGLLVSPKDVTVLSTADGEPTFQSPSGALAQVPAQPPHDSPPASSSSAPQTSYVTAEQFTAMSDKWAEQFARMEALLSRGNIFSTPVTSVKPIDTQSVISTTPFIPPATRPTGPVEAPVAVEKSSSSKSNDKDKDKQKKSHKSKKPDKPAHDSSSHKSSAKPEKSKRDRSPSPVRKHSSSKGSKSVPSSGPESGKQTTITKASSSLFSSTTTTGSLHAGTGSSTPSSAPTGHGQSTGACAFPPDTGIEHYDLVSDDDYSHEDDRSGNLSDEGQLSDSTEVPEKTEEMTYRETVRSVRSYMGWHHVPTFETTFSDPDKTNNPWKGKNPQKPTRVSVAMPPDDWLCQKLERLNLTALEGYPSRSQDSAGLKKDQFIKVPKSQSKWYAMHLVKPDGPHRPGRTVCSWRNTEAKVNSQFPRITRASAYPSTGPPSRPISQESIRRWERAAREDSYIINHAAGFSRCSTELQDKMSQNVATLSQRLSKGKTSKEIADALNDLCDLLAFHQRVSIALGTSLQHLADSLFVHMSNMILLRRDSYLDFVKPGVKQDTMNNLRNAPMFGLALFPDATIMTAEQDIQKFESSSVAQGPGPGAHQHTSWRGSHRYKPYDRRDRRPSYSEQSSQAQQQPWRQFSRSRGRGRGRGSNPRFSRNQSYKQSK